VLDQNGNRRRDPREAFDTARVTLHDSAAVELYAFIHDTLGPRLKTVDFVDSLTLRLTFDRPLDPSQAPDTSMVHIAPAGDSTQLLAISRVLTPASFDSLTKAAAAARDTAPRRPPPGEPPRPPRPRVRRAAPRRPRWPVATPPGRIRPSPCACWSAVRLRQTRGSCGSPPRFRPDSRYQVDFRRMEEA